MPPRAFGMIASGLGHGGNAGAKPPDYMTGLTENAQGILMSEPTVLDETMDSGWVEVLATNAFDAE